MDLEDKQDCMKEGRSSWLTVEEAVRYLRLPSTMALYRRVERGQVRAHRLGRSLRFLQRDLDVSVLDLPEKSERECDRGNSAGLQPKNEVNPR